jgi:hypothetical protein
VPVRPRLPGRAIRRSCPTPTHRWLDVSPPIGRPPPSRRCRRRRLGEADRRSRRRPPNLRPPRRRARDTLVITRFAGCRMSFPTLLLQFRSLLVETAPVGEGDHPWPVR